VDAVRSGSLDLALVSPVAGRAPGVELDPLLTEDLVLVCWPGHPLADRPRVQVADAAGQAFVDFPSGWGIRTAADRLFESAGLERAVTTEVTDFVLALDLVRRRLGITIIPASSAPDDGSVVKLPLVGAPSWTVFLARPSGRALSVAALKLADAILAGRPAST
jgi:DNA-binding transcriptional LysR family regulator